MSVVVTQLYEEVSQDEGRVLHPYYCSEGFATVGIGHKILPDEPENLLPVHGVRDPVPADEGITEERCFELFQADIQDAIDGCESLYSNWEELPQEMQHVLANMVFQMGKTGVSNFRNMNDAIAEQDFEKVAHEMVDSRWAQQQTPERAKRLQARVLALTN